MLMIYYASIMQMYFMTIECLCLLSFKVYIKLRKTLNYDHFSPNLISIQNLMIKKRTDFHDI